MNGENGNYQPPAHIIADWNYFQKHNKKRICIPLAFDRLKLIPDNAYCMKVGHVYDLSKFWVVVKHKELDIFHKYLNDFYSQHKQVYRIPEDKFSLNMYCIVYTEEAYYRAILVNVPLLVKGKKCGYSYLIDFGYMAKVDVENFYFMTIKMHSVPQFAIRATLSGLGPMDSSTWTNSAILKFKELVSNQILYCQVTNKDQLNKTVYLKMAKYDVNTQSWISISDILVLEKLAKQLTILNIREMKLIQAYSKSKTMKKDSLSFLLPTFAALENGLCSENVFVNTSMRQFSCV